MSSMGLSIGIVPIFVPMEEALTTHARRKGT